MTIIHYTVRDSLEATIYVLGAFGVMTFNLVLYLVAFSTRGWGWVCINENSGESIGMWTRCRDVAENPLTCEALIGNQASTGRYFKLDVLKLNSIIIVYK